MIRNLSLEFENRRRAIGFLKSKSEEKDYQGNKYMMFVIRYVMLKYKTYRIIEYSMSASGQVLRDLMLIEPGSLVNVMFEIKSKEKQPGWHITSLRCLDIFQYGTVSPQWYWDIKDGMTVEEGMNVKKLLAQPPDIDKYLKENSPNRAHSIKDYVKNEFGKRVKKAIESETDDAENDLPF